MVVASEVVHGVVSCLFPATPRFTAGRLQTDHGKQIHFAGPTFVRLDEPVSLRGRWEIHRKYGLQFKTECVESAVALDPAGLANFLANHPDIHGIGPVKARRIAAEFGTDFDRVIRTDPAAVARIAKIPIKTVMNLRDVWDKTADLNATMSYRSGFGLTNFQVT